ncbi:hypothetical protein EON79_02560 [bacterium]|nr:MAG: hypothetical protein EON79_02560 [bacterium]
MEEAFAPLVGLPISDMWRYGCQKFEIGEQKSRVDDDGDEFTCADWGLVVSGSWRIEGPDGFVLSSDHFGPDRERHDEHGEPFYRLLETAPPTVLSIVVEDDGGLFLPLSEGFSLRVSPNEEEAGEFEEWRLMPPDDDPRGHLVLEGDEVEWSGCG